MKRKYLYIIFILLILVRSFLLLLEIKYSLYLKGTYSGIVFNFVIIISGYTRLGLKDIKIEWINEGEVCVYHSTFNGVANLNIKLSEE